MNPSVCKSRFECFMNCCVTFKAWLVTYWIEPSSLSICSGSICGIFVHFVLLPCSSDSLSCRLHLVIEQSSSCLCLSSCVNVMAYQVSCMPCFSTCCTSVTPYINAISYRFYFMSCLSCINFILHQYSSFHSPPVLQLSTNPLN